MLISKLLSIKLSVAPVSIMAWWNLVDLDVGNRKFVKMCFDSAGGGALMKCIFSGSFSRIFVVLLSSDLVSAELWSFLTWWRRRQHCFVLFFGRSL